MRFLFSDEKLLYIDGVYNSQNKRVWAPSRTKTDVKDSTKEVQNFPTKVMTWFGVCSKGVSPLVIFVERIVGHEHYIHEVLPVALKFGNDIFGNNWTFQQDGGRPRVHQKTQEGCRSHLPLFIDKDYWPPNSSDLNPLDYCIRNEFAGTINRDLVRSKVTLINQLKLSLKKIHPEVVVESCISWTNRLKQVNGN